MKAPMTPASITAVWSSADRDVILTGSLVAADGGYPLAGLAVFVRLELAVVAGAAPGSGQPKSQTFELARGVSSADGRFALVAEESVPGWVLRLATGCGIADERAAGAAPSDAADGGATATLYAQLGRRSVELGPVPLGAATDRLAPVYRVPMPPAQPNWKALGRTAAQRRVTRVNQLAALLADPTAVPDPAVRAAATAQLEAAVLDPDGTLSAAVPLPSWAELVGGGLPAYEEQVRAAGGDPSAALSELRERLISFDNLGQVDWDFDRQRLSDIGRNDERAGTFTLGDAVNVHAGLYRPGAMHLPGVILGPPNPLIGYRDYLVGVWATMAANHWYWAYDTALTAAQAAQQLANRFHQDFGTTDRRSSSANELAIAIVSKVLTDPAPTGYGLAAASIPARGAASAREYLDTLIGLSGVSTVELGLRYRIDLARGDAATSSAVAENIATLQGFFRDGFQSEPDPFHTQPDVRDDTIIPGYQLGKAPFYLQFEEWQAQTAVFYPENSFSMSRSLRADELSGYAKGLPASDPVHNWAQDAAKVFDDVQKATGYFTAGETQLGLTLLEDAHGRALNLISTRVSAGYDLTSPMKARKRFAIPDKPALLLFERYLGYPSSTGNPDPYDFPGDWDADRLSAALVLFAGYFYWVWRSDALLSIGRFTEAATALEGLLLVAVGAAEQDRPAGYFDYWNDDAPYLYTAGDLPYTYDRTGAFGVGDPDNVQSVIPWFTDTKYEGAGGGILDSSLPARVVRPLLHRTDQRFLQLRLGNVLLEWADALFRADDASSTARARELYKAVLWLHGEQVPISPTWPENHQRQLPFDDFGVNLYFASIRNPAVVSQTSRARLGFTEIEAGLNYFGCTSDMVPVQRYRTLKDAADHFAALAVAAERDFLAAMANLEQLSIEEMKTSNLLAKAKAQQSIAGEQQQIAKYNVSVAKQQVADVQKKIDAKKQEIADHDSFFGQLSDFASGLTSVFTGAPGFLTSGIGSGIASEAGFSSAEAAGLLGSAGLGVLAGYGLFVYAGYTSMSSMASAYAGRAGELKRMETVDLPLAQGNVDARQHEVTISQLQASIAEADIQLAQAMIAFNTQRLLNAEFWTALAQVLRRVLRRYLDLGAWSAWLAERALAFEQDRELHIVRMDYLVRNLQGVTGGQLLQGDLAELEAARISGERALVPFSYALSLAEEFPLAFGALKAGGRCDFATGEELLRRFFPGTYGHRARTVTVSVRTAPAGRRIRGILVNHGVSMASVDESLAPSSLLRFPDAVAISESAPVGTSDPRLAEVLGPFEGIGLDTGWTLQLDPQASAGWWDAIADVVIQIDGLARYSEAVRLNPPAPAARSRFVFLSAARFAAEQLDALRATGRGPVDLDLRLFPFPADEKKRAVTNVVVLLPGAAGKPVKAHLRLSDPATDVDFTVADAQALSNGEPLRLPGSATPDAPLNAAIGATADQLWQLSFTKTAGADLSGLLDVIVGVDYTADPA